MTCAISVLVPVYNATRYLADCLESLRAQTFTDFEIICFNGGSTDNSLDILHTFAQKEPRARIIDSSKNRGISAARNKLLQEARGKYIAFVDADDCLLPQYLEKLYQAAEDQQADVVKCHLYDLSADGKTHRPTDNGIDLTGRQADSLPARFISAYSRHEVWAKLFRAQFLRDHHLQFVEGQVAEDTSFTISAFVLASRVAFVPEPLYLYRVGVSTSIMGKKGRFITMDVLRELILVRTRLKQANVWEKGLANIWAQKVIWRLGILKNFPKKYQEEGKSLRQQIFAGMKEDLSLYGFVPRLRWGSLLWMSKLLKGKRDYLLCKIFR